MNFCAYYRVSTEGRDSITTQRALLADFADRAGHSIVVEQEDEAVSGGVPVAE